MGAAPFIWCNLLGSLYRTTGSLLKHFSSSKELRLYHFTVILVGDHQVAVVPSVLHLRMTFTPSQPSFLED